MKFKIIALIFLMPYLAMAQVSDKEARNIWNQMKKRGQGLEDVEDVAEKENMTQAEAADLRNKIQKFDLSERNELEAAESKYSSKQKIFGWDLFLSNEMSFNPGVNLNPPSNYILGPGDKLEVFLYGEAQKNYRLTINNKGQVIIPIVGPVSLHSTTLESARARLRSALASIYSGLNDNSISMEVSIYELRSIKINMVGEINRPGSYLIPAFSNVFNAIYSAGGPTESGTFRNIRVYREGKQKARIDLYDFLTKGSGGNSFQLQDNDFIIIGAYNKRVEVVGQVKLPGLFEIRNGESVSDIINYAGGFAVQANSEIVGIQRNNGPNQFIKDVQLNDSEFVLEDGDKIIVRSTNDPVSESISIRGAVITPGSFEWKASTTLKDLVEKAGGFLPEAHLTRISLFRKGEFQVADIRSLNYQRDLNVKLQPHDHINVLSIYDLQEEFYIQVSGEVTNPQAIPFFEGMNISDAIVLCGGLKYSAVGGSVEIARRRKGENNEPFEVFQTSVPSFDRDDTSTIELKPYDHIFIRSSPGFQKSAIVQVRGEVNYPGDYIISQSKMRISDLISRAGGLTQDAFIEGATLLRKVTLYDDVLNEEKSTEIYEDLQGFIKNKDNSGMLGGLQSEFMTDKYSEILADKRRKEKKQDLDSTFNRAAYDRIGISLKANIGEIGLEDNLVLLPGDVLSIPRAQQIVRINGEVLNPSATKFDNKAGFRKYIRQAGGFTSFAKSGKSYIVYPNGEATKTRNLLVFRVWPKVKPGSEIYVPGGKEKFGAVIERAFALTTSTVTTYFLITRLLNQ
ncbi:MAG: SLBB domain-containing protein [Cyclobacteriaceae bacterium]